MMTKKTGRNILKWSVFGVMLTSILFSLLLVYSPAVGAFGGSTASCAGSTDVYCSGYKCSATDNVGCSCRDASGTITDQHKCYEKKAAYDGGFEIMLEEFAY